MTKKEIQEAARTANSRRNCFDECPFSKMDGWFPACDWCSKAFYKGYVMGAERAQRENKKVTAA